MEASKITIGAKTYDMNYLSKAKKTALRRKMVVEYIQSKPAGTTIKLSEFAEVCHIKQVNNVDAFIKRMLRDGVIMRYEGDKIRTYYYAVLGAARQIKPKDETTPAGPDHRANPDINSFISDMRGLGVKFTITITNEAK